MLTGSKQPGDKCTEAESGARYLERPGVPASGHPGGRRQRQLREHRRCAAALGGARRPGGARHDRPLPRGPLHGHRLDLGLTPSPTPTQSSPITGWSTMPYFVKETLGVGLGRIIGYNHLEWLHDA